MSRFRRYRPSGSMLVALLALVMATTGSAVAASLITSKQIKDGTIQTADISKKARTGLKGQRGAAGAQGPQGVTGAKGDKGDKGDTGAAGANGTNGAAGAPGTARAYAVVDPAGASSLVAAQTKNFVAISRTNPGWYCLTPAAGINPATTPAMASVEFGQTATPEGGASAMVDMRTIACPTGDYAVFTQRQITGSADKNNVVNAQQVATPAAQSNTVGFIIIVP
jgi:hypothetical protein